MKKLKFMLEYQCFPIWVYNDKGELEQNGLPEDTENALEIKSRLQEIQYEFESLFENTRESLNYIGFSDDAIKKAFIDKIRSVVLLLKTAINGQYNFEVKLILNEL